LHRSYSRRSSPIMFPGHRAANIAARKIRGSDQRRNQALLWIKPFQNQGLANAANTVSGAWAITARSALAGPRGMRLPCSQLRMVSTGTPSRAANSCCVRRARRRRSRTTGEVAISGVTVVIACATLVVACATEVLAGGANGIEGASGNSRPSRSSTIRPSAYSRKRCMPIPPAEMIGDRR